MFQLRFALLVMGFLVTSILAGQNYFSRYYPFDSQVSNFRALLVDRDTILLEGIFVDTIDPFLQGIAFAKVDSFGNLISYQRYFDPKGRDLTYPPLNNLIKLSDGRYLTPAMTFQDNALLLIFLNSQFRVDTVFEYFANDVSVRVNLIRSVFELKDGYMVFGSAQQLSFANDGQIFRIKKNGELLWRKWYDLPNKDEAFGDVSWFKDSTFAIGSFHKPFPINSQNKLHNIWIFVVDTNGNILHEFVDQDPYSGTSGGIVIDDSKNIYFTGATIIEDMYGLHNAIGHIGKLDENLQPKWKITFGKNLSINTGGVDMILSNRNLIATGTVVDTFTLQNSNTRRPHFGWTIMASTNGDSICERFDTSMWYLPISSMGRFLSMDTLSSGNIIVCGEGRFGPEDDTRDYAWLVKMPNPPCEGLTVSNDEILSDITSTLQIRPNPVSDEVMIGWDESLSLEVDYILLFDMDGRLVQKKDIHAGVNILSLDLLNLVPGAYIVHLISKGGYLLGLDKLIVQR